MKSGNVFTIKFKKFEITKLSGSQKNRELTYDSPSNAFTLDVDEIECVIIN